MFDDDTLSRLRIVLANSARALNSTVTTAGLTPTEASVLGLIYSRGPLPSSALRELEGLNATMLSRMVSALTRRGLVIRRPDPNDQRAAVLEVTDGGRALAAELRQARTRTLAECLERLPARTATTIVRALPSLEALADELRADPE